jgi:hypothetical protein
MAELTADSGQLTEPGSGVGCQLSTGLAVPAEVIARRSLRGQIAHLEAELAAWHPAPPATPASRGPRLLSLGELEQVRDALARRLAAATRAEEVRGLKQEVSRRLREEMLLAPGRHALVRVTNADVGEPGCCDWHVRPRFGLLGMLMNWWRVKISSGCP